MGNSCVSYVGFSLLRETAFHFSCKSIPGVQVTLSYCVSSLIPHGYQIGRATQAGVWRRSCPLYSDLYSEWLSEVSQSCPTLCDPMDCSLQCSSVHGIFQARVLEWGDISFSRGSSQPRDRTWVSRMVGRCFTIWATREVECWAVQP